MLHPTGVATGLVVPTSALTARGRGYTVQVDRNGKLSTAAVTIGASGPTYTQVTGGLTVVIADLAAPLPTATAGAGGGAGGGNGGAGGSGGARTGP
ncbi:hypothetical protein ODJ79_11525 [Actinoplanes sp. KI2]|uniref:hypothetical protein n=1 Tax=Actinoplanes sp. KI2 TaxID=2983315 RepID=UPI0021D61416|nr:hypothetical protein [Actinoplanes sp. KI2]MCU7724347.1 hypothetical protein [Actinoplanes sp. KI2]